jgi:hypothetical protein
VSKSAVEALIASGEIDATKYRWEDYPFTVAARIEFVDFFNRSLQDAKPRDICNKLYDAAFIASKTGKRLIDEACLRAAKM